MVLTCPACGSKSSLDDKKVPKGPFQAKCAKCSHLFRVDPAEAADTEMAAVMAEVGAPPSHGPSPGVPTVDPRGVELARTLASSTIEDELHALVCEADDGLAQAITRALGAFGYDVERCRTTADGQAKVDEGFAFVAVGTPSDDPEGGKALLRRMAAFAPDRRRAITTAFITTKHKSMDGLAAFVLAADFVIAVADIGRAADLIRDGLRGKEQLYRGLRRAQAKLSA